MLKADRQLGLLNILQGRTEAVRITELATLLHVTPMTVRRDVAELARQGRVLVTHGGVRLQAETVSAETVYDLKLTEDRLEKDAIARAALAHVTDGMTLFLDGGTTVGALAPHLTSRRLTVITNALNVVNVIARSRRVRLMVIGGTFRRESLTFLGPKAVSMLRELRYDIAFLGTEGFDWDRGFEVPDETDAEIKALAARTAGTTIVLAAGSKLGRRFLCRFANWGMVDYLITSERRDQDMPPVHQGTRITWVHAENG
ncbi:MAG: DeoR/GlpR family DNA-binding transcription regulator [Firmicutes bacterium]|nr:DeoR/GlpR family DNA-binding transcription regulator [Bacillota bacterium]